ncbi:MAG: DNA polymerase I [Gemmatimonadetes bacterium]|nr:DNA polymerase I [Gemmatimonadota bacterium]
MNQTHDVPTLFLLDGHALIYRAFFAMISRPLTTSSGENTSAPFGLARFLIRLMEDHDPDYVGVVLDAGDSYRTEVYPEYKATRAKMPDEMAASLPRVRNIVEAFHVPVIEIPDWEADDVIGTLARQAAARGVRTVIVSGDKDFYQLIDDMTHLLNPGRGGPAGVDEERVTPDNASERLGVPPWHVTDYLALIGDSSDNIPGVRGIGKKTAPDLIERFGDLEQILAHAEDIQGKRVRNALIEYPDMARLSKQLVTIRLDAPIELDLDALARAEPDRQRLRQIFLDLEFHTLARDWAPDDAQATGRVQAAADGEGTPVVRAAADDDPSGSDYQLVTDTDQVPAILDEMRAAGTIAVDTETTGTDPMRAELVGVSLSAAEGTAYYLAFGHVPSAVATDPDGNPMLMLDVPEPVPNLPAITAPAMTPLRDLLADESIRKVGHNIKYDMHVLARAGAPLGGVYFDSSLASYVLDPGKRQHGLDILVLDRFQTKLTSYADVAGSGRSEIPFPEVSLEAAAAYSGEDADYTLRLYGRLKEELEAHSMLDLLEDIEMPLVPVLADMEKTGIGIDLDVFDALRERFTREIAQIEEEIYKLAGGEVNLRSVPQMRELLFERLELPILRKTKTGPSTDEGVLSELAAQGHQIPRLILEYRELDKLDGTYVSKLPALVHPDTDRIHTTFNQTVAATGRLSSSDPNLQNIPVRTALGREIRKGFVADEGYLFLSADYSQIELRVLAHLSGDPAFVEAFRADRDIHRETAARIFGVDADAVSGGMRDQAKTINFATIYGQGPVALAAQLGISRTQADEFIASYFERFSGVRQYLDAMKELAAERGYVETLLGRRRYIPEMRSRNPGVRAFGERLATNSPIQGTAADLLKIAMIRLHDRLATGDTGARMLLQVHDELLLEVPEVAVEQTLGIVREEMEGAIQLDVPLKVDAGFGRSWYDSKGS